MNVNDSVQIENKQEEKEEIIQIPSIQKIIKFTISAIGVWLCSPFLSLIDTSSKGLVLSGIIQQAALNPAVAVTNYGSLLIAFMYTATNNLVASTRGVEANCDDKLQTQKALINALQLSGYVGMILGSIMIGLGPILLKTIIGNDAMDPKWQLHCSLYKESCCRIGIGSIGMYQDAGCS